MTTDETPDIPPGLWEEAKRIKDDSIPKVPLKITKLNTGIKLSKELLDSLNKLADKTRARNNDMVDAMSSTFESVSAHYERLIMNDPTPPDGSTEMDFIMTHLREAGYRDLTWKALKSSFEIRASISIAYKTGQIHDEERFDTQLVELKVTVDNKALTKFDRRQMLQSIIGALNAMVEEWRSRAERIAMDVANPDSTRFNDSVKKPNPGFSFEDVMSFDEFQTALSSGIGVGMSSPFLDVTHHFLDDDEPIRFTSKFDPGPKISDPRSFIQVPDHVVDHQKWEASKAERDYNRLSDEGKAMVDRWSEDPKVRAIALEYANEAEHGDSNYWSQFQTEDEIDDDFTIYLEGLGDDGL